MSTPINMEDLRTAIEQIRPELPTILGKDYPAFAEELDSYLQMDSKNCLWDLFGRYPVAHERLRAALPQPEIETTKGFYGPFGRINTSLPDYVYRCENGPHIVVLHRAGKLDTSGNQLCPDHDIVMNPVSPKDVQEAIERLRPELPQLLGANSAAFVTKLDALLPSWNAGQFWGLSGLFKDHPTVYQRLLQALI